jgi:hypothetical protein
MFYDNECNIDFHMVVYTLIVDVVHVRQSVMSTCKRDNYYVHYYMIINILMSDRISCILSSPKTKSCMDLHRIFNGNSRKSHMVETRDYDFQQYALHVRISNWYQKTSKQYSVH